MRAKMGAVFGAVGVVAAAVFVGPLALSPVAAAGTVHYVVAGQSIQAAIDAAGAGDTIDVAAGEYHENIIFGTKALTVHGAGAGTTTIVGLADGYVAQVSGERSSILEGFTLTGGHYTNNYVSSGGVGISGSPTIRRNTITKNVVCGGGAVATRGGAPLIQGNVISDNYRVGCASFGGGIGVGGGAPEILDNTITGNVEAISGGGIDLNGSAAVIRGNLIAGNRASQGGGISVVNTTPAVISDNVITANRGYFGDYGMSAGVYLGGSATTFVNNTVARNLGVGVRFVVNPTSFSNNVVDSDLQAIVCDPGYLTLPLTLNHNDVHSGSGESYSFGCGPTVQGAGNTRADPKFIDPEHGDLRLGVGSPAIDAGDNGAGGLPAIDYYGHPRIADGDGDGIAVVDMGAFEDPRGAGFHAVIPFRLLDSRMATGVWGAKKLVGGSPRSLAVAGVSGVPAGATAVVMSVTVTNGTLPSFLTVFPDGAAPVASNLNFAAGETTSNLVVARLGPTGAVEMANAAGEVDVVADVLGTFDDGTGAGDLYTPVTPTRVLDSRGATGGWAGPLGAGQTRPLTVVGTTVPAAATAAIVNLTVTAGTEPSFVRVTPFGAPPGATSNVLFASGQTVSALAIVGIGDAGRLAVTNQQGSVHVVADVVGYFAPVAATPVGHRFHPMTPARVLDDRSGVGLAGAWGPNQTRTLAMISLRVPAGARGVAMNTTATNATAGSFVTVSPSPTPAPSTSSLLFGPGDTRANLTVTGLPPSGGLDIYNQLGTVDIVGDVTGYFAPF